MNNAQHSPSPDLAAFELADAVNGLHSQLRVATETTSEGLTPSVLAMLQRLIDRGPMSAADLAQSERVSQQAIAQRLTMLKPTGYVTVEPDPTDRRRKLVKITKVGTEVLKTIRATEANWLTHVITETLSPAEITSLREWTALVNRLSATTPVEDRVTR